jgi:WD40 repeat protein
MPRLWERTATERPWQASGAEVGSVVLWDVASRKRLVDGPLVVAGHRVRSVAFSPDCKTIAVGYSVGERGGGGVVLCDVNLESWKHIAAQVANRNLTPGEWQQYFQDQPYQATFPDLPVPREANPK